MGVLIMQPGYSRYPDPQAADFREIDKCCTSTWSALPSLSLESTRSSPPRKKHRNHATLSGNRGLFMSYSRQIRGAMYRPPKYFRLRHHLSGHTQSSDETSLTEGFDDVRARIK